MAEEVHVVTGAFGYTGKYIARRLLDAGVQVRTLTGHPDRPNEFGGRVPAYELRFDRPDQLVAGLRGAKVLYNTYWIRFPRGDLDYERAVANTQTLVDAAKMAGVERVVHVSITNPSARSPFPYFRGKALAERVVVDSGLSHGIIRPTVIFGPEGILINNIAWLLRRFPVFPAPGTGNYRLQPVFVEDVAELAVSAGQRQENLVWDTVSPERYNFNRLVRAIARAVGSRAAIVHVPPALALRLSRLVGLLVRDVVITRAEIDGLMADLLVANGAPNCGTAFSSWLRDEGRVLGRKYASELRRHYS